jgi:hypothetical protein
MLPIATMNLAIDAFITAAQLVAAETHMLRQCSTAKMKTL